MIFCRESHSSISTIRLKPQGGGERVIEIGPGEAFGTGNQPSTRLCIELLEDIFKEREIESVLDVGCGTGVLAISAMALGAKVALAIDVDPVAVEEARTNAKKNGFSDIQIVYDSIKGVRDKFDLVIANLGTSEILNMSGDLKSRLRKNGLLLVSGIWSTGQKERVIDRFGELGLSLDRESSIGEWIALLFNIG
ncbi:MAG TPA: 50S ribosomal protein L11 methyltransferase [Thermodesulfobacteriota bacterium]|nr:50S ribosomal protein L11 methyltransferase [Thermodesulfobacteriota bacterium]